MISYNIAFAGNPHPSFLDKLRELASLDGVPIVAATLTEGPGCRNLGIGLADDFANHENFVTQLTMALMPAKFSRCDGDPALVEGRFATALGA